MISLCGCAISCRKDSHSPAATVGVSSATSGSFLLLIETIEYLHHWKMKDFSSFLGFHQYLFAFLVCMLHSRALLSHWHPPSSLLARSTSVWIASLSIKAKPVTFSTIPPLKTVQFWLSLSISGKHSSFSLKLKLPFLER